LQFTFGYFYNGYGKFYRNEKKMFVKYNVDWACLGTVDYKKSLELQNTLKKIAAKDETKGYVLFLEHPPTITLGYSLKGDEGRSEIRSSARELEKDGVIVVQVDRGGKATYHGPGQLVCYLILNLKNLKLGVKRYVGKIETVVQDSLTELGLNVYSDPEYPGVWVNGAKLAAVGIRVTDRLTTHGFALNVDPDLKKFGHIVPCGISDKPVTSIVEQGMKTPERKMLLDLLTEKISAEMKIGMTEVTADEIWSAPNLEDA
jgi:lipoate-protein ligase B